MSNQIYFSGFRLEHFTGWDGSGSPSYYGLGSSMAAEENKLSYITLTNNQVLWGDIDNTNFDDIYLSGEMYHNTNNHFGNIYFCDSNNNIVGLGFNRNNDDFLTINCWSGNYSSSTISRTSLFSLTETYGYTVVRIYRFTIKLSSSDGKSYDTATFYYSSSNNSYITTTIETINLTTKLTNIKSCFVFKDTLINTYGYQTLFYLISANYDLRGTYLDYAVASNIGYQTGWAGSTSGFSTYPITLSQTDITNYSGTYCITPNQSVSYTLSKSLNMSSGYSPSTVIISSPMISSEDGSNVSNIVPYIYKKYTNGYSGSYSITIPNYLASGTGICVVFYLKTSSSIIHVMESTNTTDNNTPFLSLNDGDSGNFLSKCFNYVQYDGSSWDNIVIENSLINDSWNTITVFNNNGTLNLTINSTTATGAHFIDNKDYTLNFSNDVIIGSITYTKSSSVSYPFDKDSNVTSYIDFADPNNPTIHGDKTQFSVNSSSLSPSTSIGGVPEIDITSIDYSSYSQEVTTTGGNHMFYLYDDPVTGSSWKNDTISSYQFGLTKIS